LCLEDFNEYIWWGKFRRLVEFLGLGPWCMVKFVVEFLWICLKRKIQENKNLPILRRKLRCILILHTPLRNFAANFAGKTSPAKVCQQNCASYLHFTNK
jgi:hypothetical protein